MGHFAFSFCASILLFVISIVYLYKNRHISPHIYWCVLLTVLIAPVVLGLSMETTGSLLPQDSFGQLTPKASVIQDLIIIIAHYVTCFAIIWYCLKRFFNCSEWEPLLLFGFLSCAFFWLGILFLGLIMMGYGSGY